MKKSLIILSLLIVTALAGLNDLLPVVQESAAQERISPLQQAFTNRQSNLQLQGEGEVIAVLPDDNDGSRHQKFILRLSHGQTLLVAHNIDLAPRIKGLKKGDSVEFYGEYEWNKKGGVIHWTHDDPSGRHEAGWLRHRGVIYQ